MSLTSEQGLTDGRGLKRVGGTYGTRGRRRDGAAAKSGMTSTPRRRARRRGSSPVMRQCRTRSVLRLDKGSNSVRDARSARVQTPRRRRGPSARRFVRLGILRLGEHEKLPRRGSYTDRVKEVAAARSRPRGTRGPSAGRRCAPHLEEREEHAPAWASYTEHRRKRARALSDGHERGRRGQPLESPTKRTRRAGNSIMIHARDGGVERVFADEVLFEAAPPTHVGAHLLRRPDCWRRRIRWVRRGEAVRGHNDVRRIAERDGVAEILVLSAAEAMGKMERLDVGELKGKREGKEATCDGSAGKEGAKSTPPVRAAVSPFKFFEVPPTTEMKERFSSGKRNVCDGALHFTPSNCEAALAAGAKTVESVWRSKAKKGNDGND
ncbi:hypothetical protein B0H16DRAFT_1700132 [Mycena metata]|uniref:Uncharacterized protein n=1 Tax=Mycena metata TaxID=1033252 RepID=A0AAD7HG71_9AGAR|nr:hypothetical protein B0H16DRAFT_1700132 [Mycena metata]